MPPTKRRITTALIAVLRTMLGNDDQHVPFTAAGIVALTRHNDATVLDILARITADGYVDTTAVNPKSATNPTARPVTAYTLNARGADYARSVLEGRTRHAGGRHAR